MRSELVLVLLALSAMCGAAEQPPNVVIVLADDMGYADLGCTGAKVPTPAIDELAQQGTRFTDAYVSAPICAPSRFALLTGRYQQRYGCEFNALGRAPDFCIPPELATLPALAKSAGYATMAIGKWHLGMGAEQGPTKRGFDHFFGFTAGSDAYFPPRDCPIIRDGTKIDEKEYLTDAFAREAVSFIAENQSRPFFLYLAFNAVHGPAQAAEDDLAAVKSAIADHKPRVHAAMERALDRGVKTVVAALADAKLSERTLLIFLNDNGGPTPESTASNAPFRGYKRDLFEGGIRVPMIAFWPGHVAAGKTDGTLVSTLDFMPTLAALIGKPKPEGADGMSLLPVLHGKTDEALAKRILFWRCGSQAAARRGSEKWLRFTGEEPRLYDVDADVHEDHDLAAQRSQEVAELGKAYAEWEKQMRPPLPGLIEQPPMGQSKKDRPSPKEVGSDKDDGQ